MNTFIEKKVLGTQKFIRQITSESNPKYLYKGKYGFNILFVYNLN